MSKGLFITKRIRKFKLSKTTNNAIMERIVATVELFSRRLKEDLLFLQWNLDLSIMHEEASPKKMIEAK